jgi:CheY-like chemotaxis protein
MEASGANRATAPADFEGGQRILVVDDQASIRETLAELLEIEGYRVETAPDGLAALRRLHQAKPDVMLVDLMMPGLDGWSLVRACRADPTLTDLSVIVMSARLDAAQSVAGLGVRACLTKPFELDELLDVLEDSCTAASRCATCDAIGTTRQLRVFAEGARVVQWALCTSCWKRLEAGFHRLRRGGSFAEYLGRPGFCITDSELHGYLRVAQH